MNKLISNFYNTKKLRNIALLILTDAIFTILGIFLIPNKTLSILNILGIIMIDLTAAYSTNIKNLKIENLFTKRTKTIYLSILFIFAFAPSLFGYFFDKANLSKLVFGNLIPNILGSLIICSFIYHISKFNYKNFIIKIFQTDYVIRSILKIFFFFCFFNSCNYFLNKTWKYANIINNIYLFIVILSGLILGCVFFYRIFIDNTPFDYSPKEVYPTFTLFCGAAFLASCSLPSFFIEVSIEPILLILNTLTAFTTALAALYFIIRKSAKNSEEYPFVEFGVFSLLIITNCCIYIVHHVENLGNILYQFSTGGSIFIAVILALYILNKKADKSNTP